MKLKHLVPLLSVFVLAACAKLAATDSTNAESALAARVRALEDRNAILYTMYTYAHALDYNLEDEWRDIWTEDATRADEKNKAEIVDMFLHHPHAPDTYWKHMLFEPRIQLDGDRATAQSYLSRFLATPDNGGPVVASFGRYRDILVRGADGKWRFKERRIELESCIKQCGGFPGHSFPVGEYSHVSDGSAYIPEGKTALPFKAR